MCILPEQQRAPGTSAVCRLALGCYFCLRRRSVGWQLLEGAEYEGRTRLQSPPCSVRTACACSGILHPQLSQSLESKSPKAPFSRALGTATRPPMPCCRLARPADPRLPSLMRGRQAGASCQRLQEGSRSSGSAPGRGSHECRSCSWDVGSGADARPCRGQGPPRACPPAWACPDILGGSPGHSQ